MNIDAMKTPLIPGPALLIMASFAAGCDAGQPHTAGVGGDAGAHVQPEGCVDIHVSGDIITNPSEWAANGQTLPLGVWGTDRGIHVAWGADRPSGTLDGVYMLLVATFDPSSGALLGVREYDVLHKPNSGMTFLPSPRGRTAPG